jgi:hypothetical protein
LASWKKFGVGKIFANSIFAVPVEGASSSPALLQLTYNLDVATSAIFPGFQVLEERIYQLAEIHAEPVHWYEIVHKVVQYPMSKGNKGPHTHDPAEVVLSVDCPPQPGDEIRY